MPSDGREADVHITYFIAAIGKYARLPMKHQATGDWPGRSLAANSLVERFDKARSVSGVGYNPNHHVASSLHCVKYPNDQESYNMGETLVHMAENEEVQALRDLYNADLVQLVGHFPDSPGVCGGA